MKTMKKQGWLIGIIVMCMIITPLQHAYAETVEETSNTETIYESQSDETESDTGNDETESDTVEDSCETENGETVAGDAVESETVLSNEETSTSEASTPSESSATEPMAIGQVSGLCGPNATYYIYNGICTISGTGTIYNEAFKRNDTISSVIIGEGITNIGDSVFYSCPELVSVKLPNSLESIGTSAFQTCSKLETVNFPKSLGRIDSMAFKNCSNLKSVFLPANTESLGIAAFEECTGLETVKLPDKISIVESRLFKFCSKLKEINIPDSVTEIGYQAFYSCQFESIKIPVGVTKIGYEAFRECISLTYVDLEGKIEQIPDGLFYNCVSLMEIDVPVTVNSIGNYAFSGLPYQSAVFCVDNTYVKDYCEQNYLSYVYELNGICGENASFSYDRQNRQLTISGTPSDKWSFPGLYVVDRVILDNVKIIPDSCFDGYVNLKNVQFLDELVEIGDNAFKNCTSLENINLPSKLKHINFYAFNGCTSLKNVDIPSSVVDIGGVAFGDCSSLESVNLPDGLNDLGFSVFRDCSNLKSLTIPSVSYLNYSPVEGCSTLKEVTIKEGPKSIPENFFDRCVSLEKVKIPRSVKTIGDNVFDYCNTAVIYGYEGSYAKVYAENHGLAFKYLDGIFADPNEESIEGFVVRLYQLTLGREPDGGGFDIWCNVLKNKESSGADVGIGFVFSKELIEKNLSHEEFVEILYQTFLNRSADKGGKQNWVNLLKDGVTRMYVYQGFAESNEFGEICGRCGITRGNVKLTENRDKNAKVTAFVSRLYNVCLGRPAEEGGLNNWTGQINNHETSPKDVAKGFVFSKELQEKNLSNEDYVELHYNAFMGRGADAPGKANWVNQLESGKISREALFWGFANSSEFEEIIASYGL